MTPSELREAVHGIIHDFTGEGSEEAADAAIAIVLDAAAEEIMSATEAGEKCPASFFLQRILSLKQKD